jgi:hypothetical protein
MATESISTQIEITSLSNSAPSPSVWDTRETLRETMTKLMCGITVPVKCGQNKGSGFFAKIGEQVYLLTDSHTVQEGSKIQVSDYDEGQLVKKIDDVALLRVFTDNISLRVLLGKPFPPTPLELLSIAGSDEKPYPGRTIYVVGYPAKEEKNPMVHKGHISSVKNGKFSIDATIMPGYSGAPVFTLSEDLDLFILGMIISKPVNIDKKIDYLRNHEEDKIKKIGEIFRSSISTRSSWAVDLNNLKQTLEEDEEKNLSNDGDGKKDFDNFADDVDSTTDKNFEEKIGNVELLMEEVSKQMKELERLDGENDVDSITTDDKNLEEDEEEKLDFTFNFATAPELCEKGHSKKTIENDEENWDDENDVDSTTTDDKNLEEDEEEKLDFVFNFATAPELCEKGHSKKPIENMTDEEILCSAITLGTKHYLQQPNLLVDELSACAKAIALELQSATGSEDEHLCSAIALGIEYYVQKQFPILVIGAIAGEIELTDTLEEKFSARIKDIVLNIQHYSQQHPNQNDNIDDGFEKDKNFSKKASIENWDDVNLNFADLKPAPESCEKGHSKKTIENMDDEENLHSAIALSTKYYLQQPNLLEDKVELSARAKAIALKLQSDTGSEDERSCSAIALGIEYYVLKQFPILITGVIAGEIELTDTFEEKFSAIGEAISSNIQHYSQQQPNAIKDLLSFSQP